MPSFAAKIASTALVGAAAVYAHGHVQNLVIDGVYWQGYDPTSYPYMSKPPTVAGWTASDTDNGYVAPDAFASPDIICHKNAKNAGGYATVKAGSSVLLQWSAWPDSHHGPVLDYLASCHGDCTTADKTALRFFKIDGVGLVDGSSVPGKWGSDQLIANNNSWLVQIPPGIAPGQYVLRHEIIALHSAGNSDGAQNYPQCFNLDVSGSGSDSPEGTPGESLYKETDPGILVNIYASLSTYVIPGPAMIAGATNVAQASSAVTATSSAVTNVAGATGGAGAATTSAASAEKTSPAAKAPSNAAQAKTTSSSTTAKAAAAAHSTSTASSKPAAATGPSSSSSSGSSSSSPGKSCDAKKAHNHARRHARDLARD